MNSGNRKHRCWVIHGADSLTWLLKELAQEDCVGFSFHMPVCVIIWICGPQIGMLKSNFHCDVWGSGCCGYMEPLRMELIVLKKKNNIFKPKKWWWSWKHRDIYLLTVRYKKKTRLPIIEKFYSILHWLNMEDDNASFYDQFSISLSSFFHSGLF